MPLIINEDLVKKGPTSVSSFFCQFPHFKESAEALKNAITRIVGPQNLLYVGQREFGATVPTDDVIGIIGTDDATTCHIAVLRHSGSGATCVAHFDGSATARNLQAVVDKVCQMSAGSSPGRLELHLTGGFQDERGYSEELSCELITCLVHQTAEIHLMTASFTNLNTEMRNGVPFPIIYGLGVDVKTGEIFKAEFPDKGPDLPLRSARHFAGGEDMLDIYDHHNQLLMIGPFSYRPMQDANRLLKLPNHLLRKYLSTSPEQEPAHFEDNVRASLVQLRDHPEPLRTIFTDSQPRKYRLQPDGQWSGV